MEVDPFDRGVIFEQRRTPLKPGTTNSCNGKKEDFKKSLHALICKLGRFELARIFSTLLYSRSMT